MCCCGCLFACSVISIFFFSLFLQHVRHFQILTTYKGFWKQLLFHVLQLLGCVMLQDGLTSFCWSSSICEWSSIQWRAGDYNCLSRYHLDWMKLGFLAVLCGLLYIFFSYFRILWGWDLSWGMSGWWGTRTVCLEKLWISHIWRCSRPGWLGP